MRQGDERPPRIKDDDARKVAARGGQMAVAHLTLDCAEISTMRLEEHARAVRFVPEHSGLAVRHVLGRLEDAERRNALIDAKMTPRDRRLKRAMERRFDGNRPARLAAHSRVAAAIVGVEREDVDGHQDRIVS
jgi:hypothetical protein